MSDAFTSLVRSIPQLGLEWHREAILENSRRNAPLAKRSIRELPIATKPVLVVSAGPSLYRNGTLAKVKAHRDAFCIVAIDGAYVQCLNAGIWPEYVMTLDPHPTRIVRWFGDPDFLTNSAGDDYFARQDLDEDFRKNAAESNLTNIYKVDALAKWSKLLICSTAPANVAERTKGFDRYWFAPLVDNPKLLGSLTLAIAEATGLPSLNTGGTVGTAAIIFAHCILQAKRIAVVGADLGYAADMPLERTQSWNMLKDRKDVAELYPRISHPLWGDCYTDATYWAYRNNLLSLLKAGGFTLHNCTEGGALYGPHVKCGTLAEFLDG